MTSRGPRFLVVLVHYHAQPGTVRAALEGLGQSTLDDVRVVVVDNGSTEAERRALEALDVRLLSPSENLGYGRAINLAVAQEADEVEGALAANPDVTLAPGSLDRLRAALERAEVAGPRFWWDPGRTVLLPPAERRTFVAEASAVLARRGRPWRRWARARWRRHALRHHEARTAFASWHLSGAALAFRTRAWRDLGGFDERYRLYFEETDFLGRLRQAGGRALFVPDAEAVHSWGESSRRESRASEWFAESCARYRRRTWGQRRARWLECHEAREAVPDPDHGPAEIIGARWLELSASPIGYPAAMSAVDPVRPVVPDPPSAIRSLLPPTDVHVRVVDARGRELALRRVASHHRLSGQASPP